MINLKLKKPKLIIFDWDNTLVDTWELIHQSVSKVFIEYGKDLISLEQTKQGIHNSLRDMFPVVFGEQWQEAAKKFYKHYLSIHLDYLKPLPGVVELLNELAKNKVYLSILSNKKGDILRQEVSYFGWDRYFKRIVGSMDTSQDKPSAVPVFEILKGMELDNLQEHVWFIGDTKVDMECARNSGCLPIFFGENQEMSILQVKHHFELIEIFKNTI
jgi:phosphoglycolate phosphatase